MVMYRHSCCWFSVKFKLDSHAFPQNFRDILKLKKETKNQVKMTYSSSSISGKYADGSTFFNL